MKPYYQRDGITLYCGDNREILPQIPSLSIDAIVCDPPYAEIDRDYGRLTEPEWHALMDVVVTESRRVLTATGSAVYILQPNSERVGRMRPWLWEFMAKWTREWNMPQDAWWWNWATPPTVHCHRDRGLMRPSMKACVWLGPEDCYRCQDEILMQAAESTLSDSRIDRHELGYSPSGLSMRHGRALNTLRERGGVTPFNVVVCANSDASDGGGAHGHGASTPALLSDWWVRYICPLPGTVLDPFMGSGTTGISCAKTGRQYVGIEQDKGYCEEAAARIDAAFCLGDSGDDQLSLFPTVHQRDLFAVSADQ
jgi:hypothetical protein